jgi:hypothetical protein
MRYRRLIAIIGPLDPEMGESNELTVQCYQKQRDECPHKNKGEYGQGDSDIGNVSIKCSPYRFKMQFVEFNLTITPLTSPSLYGQVLCISF